MKLRVCCPSLPPVSSEGRELVGNEGMEREMETTVTENQVDKETFFQSCEECLASLTVGRTYGAHSGFKWKVKTELQSQMQPRV